MSFSNFLESEVLDHVFGAAAYTAPATLYFGLSSTTPAEDGTNVTEPSSGSYARVAVTNNATNFPAATGGAKANGTAITWPQASGDWLAGADLTYVVVYDASTSGNLLAFGALSVAKPVLSGDTASIGVGDFDVTLN
jgi:hypothetical protein